MITRALLAAALAALPLLSGCAEKSESASTPAKPAAWVLASMPEGARPVAAVKPSAKEGDTIVVRGRIGGRKDPMSADSPVFVIMDPEVPSCADMGEDHCATPWDYCCETPESLAANNATVQIVGADGAPVSGGLAAHGFKPLDEVIVVGTVGPRPSESVLTIRATGVHLVKG